MFFDQKKSVEFEGEMPTTQYEEEEAYDEQGYAEGDDYDDDYDDEAEEEDAPGPKKDWVRTALMGTALVLVLAGGAYYAALTFAGDTVNAVVNSLPFVHHDDPQPSAPPMKATSRRVKKPAAAAAATSAAAGGQVAPPPSDVTASSDVAAVPPVPAADPAEPRAAVPAKKPPRPKAVAKAPAPKPAARVAPKAAPKAAIAPAARPAAARPKAMSAWRRAYLARTWRARQMASARGRYARARALRGRYARRRALGRYARFQGPYRAWGRPAPRSGYTVQVGSFADSGNAVTLANQLKANGIRAYVRGGSPGAARAGGSGFMVRSVALKSPRNAKRLAAQYRRAGFPARIVGTGRGLMAVEVGVYGSKAHADGVVSTLNNRGLFATVAYTRRASANRARRGGMARVYVGGYRSRLAAAKAVRRLRAKGIPAAVTR